MPPKNTPETNSTVDKINDIEMSSLKDFDEVFDILGKTTEEILDKTKHVTESVLGKIDDLYEAANPGAKLPESIREAFEVAIGAYIKSVQKAGEDLKEATEGKDDLSKKISRLEETLASETIAAEIRKEKKPSRAIKKLNKQLADKKAEKETLNVQITEFENIIIDGTAATEKMVHDKLSKLNVAEKDPGEESGKKENSALGTETKFNLDKSRKQKLGLTETKASLALKGSRVPFNTTEELGVNIKTTPILDSAYAGKGFNSGISLDINSQSTNKYGISLEKGNAAPAEEVAENDKEAEAVVEEEAALPPALTQMRAAGEALLAGFDKATLAKLGITNIKDENGKYIAGGDIDKGGLKGIKEMQKTIKKAGSDGVFGPVTKARLDAFLNSTVAQGKDWFLRPGAEESSDAQTQQETANQKADNGSVEKSKEIVAVSPDGKYIKSVKLGNSFYSSDQPGGAYRLHTVVDASDSTSSVYINGNNELYPTVASSKNFSIDKQGVLSFSPQKKYNDARDSVLDDMDVPLSDWEDIRNYTVKELKGIDFNAAIATSIGLIDSGDFNDWRKGKRGTMGKHFLEQDENMTLDDYAKTLV